MTGRSLLALVPAFALAALAACGSDEIPAPSADPTPTGTPTSSTSTPTPDAGPSDGAAPRDATTEDAQAPDAAPDAGPPAPPLVVPANTWTYVPMPGMVCGNGTGTGIAVNPASNPSAPVFVLLMGGGACWNELTCLGGAAANLDTEMDEAAVRADLARFPVLFDRARADNPLPDAHYVFVPYCTGDLHAGDSKKTYSALGRTMTVEHRGARNLDAFLPRVASTFRGASKVVLAGGSAGGFGTMLGYHRFRAAFASQRIDVLNDSGAPVQPSGSIWRDMQASWNTTLPATCTGCTTDVRNVLPYLAAQMGPTARFGLMSYTQDQTIRAFTGILAPQQFEQAVLELRSRLGARQKTFYVSGDSHVIVTQSPLPTVGGVPATTWIRQFVSDDAAWTNVGP